jgi:hypothetical protein
MLVFHPRFWLYTKGEWFTYIWSAAKRSILNKVAWPDASGKDYNAGNVERKIDSL